MLTHNVGAYALLHVLDVYVRLHNITYMYVCVRVCISFLSCIDRIFMDDYVPTTDDILHARQPTFGVTFADFHRNNLILR